jgi:hypothetical protein
MQKLTIEINSKNWNFINSLEDIKSKLANWFSSWFDEREDENYNFEISSI